MAKPRKPNTPAPSTSRPRPAPSKGLRAGAPVGHTTFGHGKVISVEGGKITVRFETAGTKVVLESYTNRGDALQEA